MSVKLGLRWLKHYVKKENPLRCETIPLSAGSQQPDLQTYNPKPSFSKEVCIRAMLQLQSDGPVVLGKCRNELKMESIFLWKRLNEAVSSGRDCGGLSARCGQCDDDNGSRVFNVFIAVLFHPNPQRSSWTDKSWAHTAPLTRTEIKLQLRDISMILEYFLLQQWL